MRGYAEHAAGIISPAIRMTGFASMARAITARTLQTMKIVAKTGSGEEKSNEPPITGGRAAHSYHEDYQSTCIIAWQAG